MGVMNEDNKQLKDYHRLTIYVGQGKRKELLNQAMEYTQASSVPEAVFRVPAEFGQERHQSKET